MDIWDFCAHDGKISQKAWKIASSDWKSGKSWLWYSYYVILIDISVWKYQLLNIWAQRAQPVTIVHILHIYAIPERIHTLPFLAAFSAGISLLLCLILLLPCGYDRRNAKHRFQCINILCGMVREPRNNPVWKYWPKIGLAITKSWDFCPSVTAR